MFDPQKRWISAKDVSQSGANCGMLLANNKSSLLSKQYTPNGVINRLRLGGRHPNQNLPKTVVPDTNVIATYSIISTDPVVSFVMTTKAPKSPAIYTSRWELDEKRGSLTRVTQETCENCNAQMQKFIQTQPQTHTSYWCSN
jgi:hypothetical protein